MKSIQRLVLVAILASAVFASADPGIVAIQVLQAPIFPDVDLTGADAVAVSPDGDDVYVTDDLPHVLHFDRDGATGLLTKTSAAPTPEGAAGLLQIPSDGAHVYAVSSDSFGSYFVIYSRNLSTGELTLTGQTPLPTPTLRATAFSGDGLSLYAVSDLADSLEVFSRNPTTGALTFVELHTDGVGGDDGLNTPLSIVVSPDGLFVYVGAPGDSKIGIWARNVTTGALTFVAVEPVIPGGAFALAISPDGAFLYAGAAGIDTYTRNPGTGLLTASSTTVAPTTGILQLVINTAGTEVYFWGGPVGGTTQIARLQRNTLSGVLTEIGSTTWVGNNPLTYAFDYLDDLQEITLSPDGANLYSVADGSATTLQSSLVAFRPLTVRCSATPLPGCRLPTLPGKATLVLKTGNAPGKGKLAWKWSAGAATTIGDYGNPVTTLNDYTLCLYDQSANPQPRLSSVLPAGGTCGKQPCWKSSPTTFKYRDAAGTPEGASSSVLAAGAAGSAKVLVKGKGALLAVPTLPLTPGVTLQLQAASGECWEASYATPTTNDAASFKAKSN